LSDRELEIILFQVTLKQQEIAKALKVTVVHMLDLKSKVKIQEKLF